MKHFKVWIIVWVVFSLTALPALAAKDHGSVMIPASFSTLAEKAKTGVVNIQTVKTVQGGGRVYRHFFGNPFGNQQGMEDFFAPFFNQRPMNRKEQSLGSGFIISKDGYIVTNNHVIKDADQIKVILYDSKEYDGEIVGTDPMTDLALVKIKAKNLVPLKFGKSSKADIGSWVVAIGSPFGLEQTVTAGIISAKGRILGSGPYDDFIQTDASINPGNSGGPLLNLEGEVIGINTAIIKSGQGIGFAIPSDLATGIIDQLTESKQVSRGWMGVAIQNVNEELADYYGIKDTGGVYVAKVYEDNPAEKAGIKPGDVITEINDQKIETSRDLTLTIANLGVNENIKVKLIRDGKEKTLKVKLGKRPDNDPETLASMDGYDTFGFQFKPMDDELARHLGYPQGINGLVVTEIKPETQAARSGVRQGDLLVEINHRPVTNFAGYEKELNKIKKGYVARMLFRRGNSHVFVVRFEK
ncbi:DegQ family serine endoprotease [Desulfospira joergensenii]|uniref:DegQ family serine endoprotease n=1 Tax=Desulfospira joergensenii TaxID=53329 RepID=UPI0003B62B86|nr:DegQ family serine endoprotease [Desulfospira joergensenii]